MLEKMEQKITINQDLIEIHVENESLTTLEKEYLSLSWLDKVIILIKSFFLSLDKYELTKKHVLAAISHRLQYVNSLYFSTKRGLASNEFHNMLSNLSKSLDFIRKPLAVCFNADKISFYLLLGKLEFPDVHKQLEENLDPWMVNGGSPLVDVQDVRKKLIDDLDTAIQQISLEDRKRMMDSTRVLYQMYQLSLFPFRTLLGQFPVTSQGEILPASLSVLRSYLADLGKILRSFYKPPCLKLLEAIFLVHYANEGIQDSDLEDAIKDSMAKTEYLLERIREFNRNVLLLDLLKVINDDPFYAPDDIGGGEDWFYFYYQYWQDKVADEMKIYIRERMIEAKKNELLRFWDLGDALILNNYNPSQDINSYAVSVSLINTFYKEIIQKVMYYPLRIILVDGEFYKKNNRVEFEESFNNMMKIGDRIRWFEHFLEPGGEGGTKIRNAIHESAGDAEMRDQLLEPLYAGINRDALVIVEDSLKIFFIMAKLLNGIVLGNGGTYDTLANFAELGGKSNTELRESVQLAADYIHKTAHSLQDLVNQEKEGSS
ncbi:MAG: hypothetical protein B6241_04140 [Spirochaetaceae bacterium 4572_59]|nr:MAG: hypothetical protein B6241_04140 [Spirochaetaceae bacterium 4572_59]